MISDTSLALDVRDVRKSFGGLRAIAGVSFSVPAGSLTALIGPNGAGKSTLFNLVTNLYRADSGSIWYFGREISGVRAQQLAAAGLVRTFQTARVLPGLTVIENVLVGAHIASSLSLLAQTFAFASVRTRERLIERRAADVLELLGLLPYRDEPAITLALGQQKIVELARAVMARPRLLLLDEPGAGLNDTETAELGAVLRALNAAGTTIVVVEHNMSLVMEIASDVVVLDAGQVIAHAPPEQIRTDRAVITAYMGQDVEALQLEANR